MSAKNMSKRIIAALAVFSVLLLCGFVLYTPDANAASTVTVSGSVKDWSGNNIPPPGVTVALVGDPAKSTTADPSNGSFSLSGVPANTPFSLKFSATGYLDVYSPNVSSAVDINLNASDTGSTPFNMPTAADLGAFGVMPDAGKGLIAGRVADATYRNSSTVGGVFVTATGNGGKNYPVFYDPFGGLVQGGTTSSNGRYYVPNVDGGDTVILSASKNGWSFTPLTFNTHADGVSEGRITGTAPGYVAMIGSVINTAGAGIAGARLELSGDNGKFTNTGSDGSYTFSGLPRDTNFYIKLTATGYVPTYAGRINLSGNTSGINITLFTAAEMSANGVTGTNGMLTCKVIDSALNPLSGATVLLTSENQVSYSVVYVGGGSATNGTGSFLAPNIQPGDSVKVEVIKAGYTFAPVYLNGFASAVTGRYIAGAVPVAYNSYVADSANAGIAGATIEQVGASPANTATSSASPAGAYTLSVPSGVPFYLRFSKVGAGYADTYSAEMTRSAPVNESLSDGSNLFAATKLTDWNVASGKGIIRSRVKDSLGNNLGGATVIYTSRQGRTYPVCYDDACTPSLTSTQGGSGRYIIKDVDAGDTVTVTARKAGYAFNTRIFHTYAGSVHQGGITGTAASVSGTVSYSGTQAGSFRLMLWSADMMGDYYQELTLTSTSGSFTFNNVPNGRYFLSAYRDSDNNGQYTAGEAYGYHQDAGGLRVITINGAGVNIGAVTLADPSAGPTGASVSINSAIGGLRGYLIFFRSGDFLGRDSLLNSGIQPPFTLDVDLTAGSHTYPVTQMQHDYTGMPVPAGNYDFYFMTGDLEKGPDKGVIQYVQTGVAIGKGAVTAIPASGSIPFTAGGTVSGTVTSSFGAHHPLGRVSVYLTWDSMGQILKAWGSTGADGQFQFDHVPAGAYWLQLAYGGYNAFFPIAVTVTDGQPLVIEGSSTVLTPTQTPATISGTLTPFGAGVDSRVLLKQGETIIANVAPDAANGSYAISDVVPGSYTLIGSARGYMPVQVPVSVTTAGQALTENFTLNGTKGVVTNGLNWLLAHQRADGSFDDNLSGNADQFVFGWTGYTGLTLLAILENPKYNVPTSPDYLGAALLGQIHDALYGVTGAAPKNGIKQYFEGTYHATGNDIGAFYNDTITWASVAATPVALEKLIALGMPLNDPKVTGAVQFLLGAQVTAAKAGNPIFAGGWRYNPFNTDTDNWETAWVIMALMKAGVNPTVQAVVDGLAHIRRSQITEGGGAGLFAYQPNDTSGYGPLGTSAACILALNFAGAPNSDPDVNRFFQWVKNNGGFSGSDRWADAYWWSMFPWAAVLYDDPATSAPVKKYYDTLELTWNMADDVISRQNSNGSWSNPNYTTGGSNSGNAVMYTASALMAIAPYAGLTPLPDETTLSGSVRNPAGAGLQNAKVEALLDGVVRASTVTDGSGAYTLSVPQNYAYTIRVTAAGYVRTAITTANVGTGGLTNQDIAYLTTGEDAASPTIASLTPAAGSTVWGGKPVISAVMADTGSGGNTPAGIDPATISMKLDGNAVTASYIASTGVVSFTPQNDLPYATHTVTIDVKDFAGNAAAQASWSFTNAPGTENKYYISGNSQHDQSTGHYSVWFDISDPEHKIISATLSGPGISGSLNLVYRPDAAKCWSPAPEDRIDFGTNSPSNAEYTVTINDASGTYTYNVTVSGGVTDFATNLSPTGGNVSGDIIFTFTGIPGGERYFVNLLDAGGNMIWSSGPGTSSTTVPYTGPSLSAGVYSYIVDSVIGPNLSFVRGEFTYTPGLSYTPMVYQVHSSDGYHTYLQITIGTNFTGTLPDAISAINATGPGGTVIAARPDFVYNPAFREFLVKLPGQPALGQYGFEVTGLSQTVTGSDTQSVNRNIPMPDKSTFVYTPGATPTFSWGAVDYTETPLYYRLIINDMAGNRVYSSSRVPGMLSHTAPAGILQADQSYQFQVRVEDASTGSAVQNQARSDFETFPRTTITYAYQVKTAAGAPLEGVAVSVDGNTNPEPSALTDAEGKFTLTGLTAGSNFYAKMVKEGYRPTYSARLSSRSNMTWDGRSYTLYTAADTAGWPVNFAEKGAIASWVADSSSNAISGAVVTAASNLHPAAPYVVTYMDSAGNFGGTATYGNGRYRVWNVDEGDIVTVTAVKSGMTFNTRTFLTHTGGVGQGKVTGTAAAGTITFSGTVTAGGQPVAGAAVQMVGDAGIATQTAPDGSYTLTGLPKNQIFALVFNKAGYVPLYSRNRSSSGNIAASRSNSLFTQAELTAWGAASGGVINGRVADGANPTTVFIAGATVSYTSANAYTVFYTDDNWNIVSGATSTQAGGRYLLVPNGAPVEGNTVTVTAAKDGWTFPTHTFVTHVGAVSQGGIDGEQSAAAAETVIRNSFEGLLGEYNKGAVASLVTVMSYFSANYLNDGVNFAGQQARMQQGLSQIPFQPKPQPVSVAVTAAGATATAIIDWGGGSVETQYWAKEGDGVWRIVGNGLAAPISYTGYVADSQSPSQIVVGASVEQGGAPTNFTTTDAAGLYTLGNLTAGTPFYLKIYKDASYAPCYSAEMSFTANRVDSRDRAFTLFPASRLGSGTGNWNVEPGKGIIRAYVRDKIDGYVGGAVVTATGVLQATYPVCYDDVCTPSLTATKDKDGAGRYVIKNVLDGDTVTVTATKTGWTFNTRVYHTFAGGVSQGRLTGQGPVSLALTVTTRGPDWTPLQGVLAQVVGFPAVSAGTGTDGSATLAGLPPNTSIPFAIGKEGYVNGYGLFSATGVSTWRITLFTRADLDAWGIREGAGVIYGRVINSADSNNNTNGVAGAQVTCASGQGKVYEVVYLNDDDTVAASPAATLSNGRYLVLNVLAGDEVSVSARKAGWSFSSKTTIGYAGGVSHDYIYGAAGGATVSMYVKDRNSVPIAGATVRMAENTALFATTDLSGKATLTNLPLDTPLTFEVMKSGYANTYSRQAILTGNNGDWGTYYLFPSVNALWGVLEGRGAVMGWVKNEADGSTLAGAQVTCVSTRGRKYAVAYLNSDHSLAAGAAATSSNGRFLILDVEPGDTVVAVARLAGWTFQPRVYTARANAVNQSNINGRQYKYQGTARLLHGMAPTNYLAYLRVDDPLAAIGSIAVTGPGIASPLNLTYDSQKQSWQNEGAIGFGATPSLPLTYTLVITEQGVVTPLKQYLYVSGTMGVRGDVNGDGVVNLTDALLSLQAPLGSLPAGTVVYTDADVDGDGRIGIPETLYILQTLSGLR